MKKVIILLAVFAAVISAAVFAGCTDNPSGPVITPTASPTVSPIVSTAQDSLFYGNWVSSDVEMTKYDFKVDIIYSFRKDNTGRVFYYIRSNNSVMAANPFTWSLDTDKSANPVCNISYTTLVDTSEKMTMSSDHASISDDYGLVYTKDNIDPTTIAGGWKITKQLFSESRNTSCDIHYEFNEDGTGKDAWYYDGELKESDSMEWDFITVHTEGAYVYYISYPQYFNVRETFFMTPDANEILDVSGNRYVRENVIIA